MRIVIVEDSRTLQSVIAGACNSYGHTATVYGGTDLSKDFYITAELYIINTRLKHASSLELIENIKDHVANPHIIGINSKGNWKDSVDFLRAGITAIMNYPFPLQELLERINIMETSRLSKYYPDLEVGALKINPEMQTAYLNDKPISLRKKEYSLLTYLAKNNERPVSRSELIDNVWDYRRVNNSNTVDVHVQRLREKIGEYKQIKTVYGYGYKLCDKD